MIRHPDWNHEDVPFAQSKAGKQMVKDQIPRMDKWGKPFQRGLIMDRLSRFYRAKMEGDLPVAISPPVELVRQDDEGILRMPSASTKSVFFTPHVTKVCGAFGGCELSTRTVNVFIQLPNDNVIKEFETQLKVVKRLPYEIMIGRQDMTTHRLSIFPREEGQKKVVLAQENERADAVQQRHVTWADHPEHTATNLPLQDERFPRHELEIRKRSSLTLAFPENSSVDNVLIMRSPEYQEEQLSKWDTC
jgi:hypothetical protein